METHLNNYKTPKRDKTLNYSSTISKVNNKMQWRVYDAYEKERTLCIRYFFHVIVFGLRFSGYLYILYNGWEV